MSITAAEVNKLRQATGAGLMDCKKALVESNGDFEAAKDYLRKKGQKISALRSDKEANEGVVIAKTDASSKKGVVVYVSSETDFVAKNEEFMQFATKVSDMALDSFPNSTDELLAMQMNGSTVGEKLTDMVGKIGEKITVSSFEKVEGDYITAYNHANNKIGVLVAFNKEADQLKESGKDIAMQVAAMKPIAISEDQVPKEIIEKEMAIGKEQALAEGKPENIVEKIATGMVKKYLKENTLINQQFVKDSSKTIGDILKSIGSDLQIKEFKRVEAGN